MNRAIADGSGSSPHTRGAQLRLVMPYYNQRIIPAYAGSTCISRRLGARKWDHPRIRGEHYSHECELPDNHGSSPHTRGAPAPTTWCGKPSGIIPAYAGSTRSSTVSGRPSQDHPRIRGEHFALASHVMGSPGSSPHTRGAPRSRAAKAPLARIIPAYAGSTRASAMNRRCWADHPRIRGEHSATTIRWKKEPGSSPHTRGARPGIPSHKLGVRIIPAYAGSTESPSRPTSSAWDHPRIRGEHTHPSSTVKTRVGSSPHTRGAPGRRLRRRPDSGIIPAYAGSTAPWSASATAKTDHPRIRGEHGALVGFGHGEDGSSPHTRGAL